MSEEIKGYKVFNPDWTCRNKAYSCPGRFQEKDHELSLCGYGMHFCVNAVDCFNYYAFNPDLHVAEVIARGNVIKGDGKCCTDDLEIVREISWDELLHIVNTGDWNTGNRNTGNWNTGDWNTGNWNTGDWNTGNRNTGDWNTGDWNTGDWNTGCFNTKMGDISLFNKGSSWTYSNWFNSDARKVINRMQKDVVEWIYSCDMTDEEKAAHPEHETTGGYIKILDESECAQIWWDGLDEIEKDIIRSIPNFDKKIFEKIMGIKTE